MNTVKIDYKEKGRKIIETAILFSVKLKGIINKEKDENEELLENLKQAKEDWEKKERYFNIVTEPDLIDYAIHDMEASKIKYIYFLKKAKEKGVSQK